jgi:hypothetical protein
MLHFWALCVLDGLTGEGRGAGLILNNNNNDDNKHAYADQIE